MKKLITLTLFLVFFYGFSQIQEVLLYNDWYLVKLEMKDGSKLFMKENYYDKDKVYTIRKDYYVSRDMSNYYRNLENFKVKYKLNKNKMVTHEETSLTIEKLTRDSLILSQNILGNEDKDLERYYFVPVSRKINAEVEKYKNADTLVASNIITPIFNNTFFRRTIRDMESKKDYQKNPIKNYRFNGYIYLNTKEKTINTILLDYNPEYTNEINQKLKYINNYKNWNINNLEKYSVIKIPFVFISYYQKKEKTESWGEIFTLYSVNYDDVFFQDKVSYTQLVTGNEYFGEAMKYYQNKNFPKAIEYFKKSYTENYRNLDAYYNYAELNYSTGHKEEACKTWDFLKNEGQKSAEKDYQLKCLGY